MLGEKRDGSLYAQEEIKIARSAAGKRSAAAVVCCRALIQIPLANP
jgi:hypothetical protein